MKGCVFTYFKLRLKYEKLCSMPLRLVVHINYYWQGNVALSTLLLNPVKSIGINEANSWAGHNLPSQTVAGPRVCLVDAN
jgi:hypothetical protein